VKGTASFRGCNEAEVSLHLEPADKLDVGDTPILLTLPQTPTLTRGATSRQMSLAQLGLEPTYRNTIDRIDIEFVTSGDSKASARLPGLSIPVDIAQ